MSRKKHGRFKAWNFARKKAQGEKYLRMAGVPDCAAAAVLWRDASADRHRRGMAARALGLLGLRRPRYLGVIDIEPDQKSPFVSAWRKGCRDYERRKAAEEQLRKREEAAERMRQLGLSSVADVITLLRNQSAAVGIRETTADILEKLKPREAVAPLIETLAEGRDGLSSRCMWALLAIGSRSSARRLMQVVRGASPLPARQEAIYALWHLNELRAESIFLHVCDSVSKEEEDTRDMATEGLRNTANRPLTQKMLAKRLFDPSISVRISALCACGHIVGRPDSLPGFLRKALEEKLTDPGRLDDHRVVAKMAADLLMIGTQFSSIFHTKQKQW